MSNPKTIFLDGYECPDCGQETLYAADVDEQELPIGEIECASCGKVFQEAIDVHVIEPCDEEGCDQPGDCACWLMDSSMDDDPDYHYCWKHARENGFCPSCGYFWAGTEAFDFRRYGDVCENCYDAGDYDDDDYDDDLDFGWDYPEWFDVIEGEEGGRWIGPGSENVGGEE